MKNTSLITATALTLALAPMPLHSAMVAYLSGNHLPNANVVEAPNTLTNAALFTTIVFAGTSWVAEDGFIKMTTAFNRGIWFGSAPNVGDPAQFFPGSTADGNKLQLGSLLTAGSQSWTAYFQDTDGYRGRIDFEATDNSQNQPGVWAETATGPVRLTDLAFNINALHDYEIHLHNGIVAYSINGVEVLRTPALQPTGSAPVLVGDSTGSTLTGTGSMWVDSFSFDNAAGPLAPIPEPATASLFLGLVTLSAIALRRRRK